MKPFRLAGRTTSCVLAAIMFMSDDMQLQSSRDDNHARQLPRRIFLSVPVLTSDVCSVTLMLSIPDFLYSSWSLVTALQLCTIAPDDKHILKNVNEC